MLFGTGTLVPSTCSRATDCPRAAFALCHRVVELEGAKVQQSPVWAGGNQTQCSEVIVSQDHGVSNLPKRIQTVPGQSSSERCQTETDVNHQFSSVPSLEPVLGCPLALFYSAI